MGQFLKIKTVLQGSCKVRGTTLYLRQGLDSSCLDYMICHGSKEVEEDWHISGEFSINAPKYNSLKNPSLDDKVSA